MGPRKTGAAVAAALWMLTGACGGPAGVPEECSGSLELPAGVATDILFVIDNSGSMAEEQAKVAAELSTFVASLTSGPVVNDFQVGVVSTGVTMNLGTCEPDGPTQLIRFDAESGRLQLGKQADGRPAPGSTRRLLRWDDPDLVDEFAALVSQGVVGSGQEMGLEAALRAVTPPLVERPLDADPSGNAGLLRPGARLLVVVVTDEDDCSDPVGTRLAVTPVCAAPACQTDGECGGAGAYCLPDGPRRACHVNACETPEGRAALPPVETYVQALQGLDDGLGRTREVFLAVIGPVDPADPSSPARCAGGGTEAQGTGVRYAAAVSAFDEHGFIDSICRDDYAETLERIAALVNAPQVLDLPDAPADPRLLKLEIRRPGADVIVCQVGEGFDYVPPVGDAPARVTMQDDCRLELGDSVTVRMYCAS